MTSDEAQKSASEALQGVATTISSTIDKRLAKIETTQKRRGREHLVYMVVGFSMVIGMVFLMFQASKNSAANEADAQQDAILKTAIANVEKVQSETAEQLNDILNASYGTVEAGVSKDQLQSAINALPDSASLVKEIAQALLDYMPEPVPGPKGDPGEPGESGSPGEPGVDGLPGEDGVDGVDGSNGSNGANGLPGISVVSITQPTPCSIKFTLSDDTSFTASNLCGAPGAQGPQGPPGTVEPGTYTCEAGAFMNSLTVSETGTISIVCAVPNNLSVDPPIDEPPTDETPTTP